MLYKKNRQIQTLKSQAATYFALCNSKEAQKHSAETSGYQQYADMEFCEYFIMEFVKVLCARRITFWSIVLNNEKGRHLIQEIQQRIYKYTHVAINYNASKRFVIAKYLLIDTIRWYLSSLNASHRYNYFRDNCMLQILSLCCEKLSWSDDISVEEVQQDSRITAAKNNTLDGEGNRRKSVRFGIQFTPKLVANVEDAFYNASTFYNWDASIIRIYSVGIHITHSKFQSLWIEAIWKKHYFKTTLGLKYSIPMFNIFLQSFLKEEMTKCNE